jgi:transcriptional regulator with XRE-family HTH domain
MTQEELAEKIGMKSQQLQRYEATDYGSASLSRIAEIADVLQVGLGGEVPEHARRLSQNPEQSKQQKDQQQPN